MCTCTIYTKSCVLLNLAQTQEHILEWQPASNLKPHAILVERVEPCLVAAGLEWSCNVVSVCLHNQRIGSTAQIHKLQVLPTSALKQGTRGYQ